MTETAVTIEALVASGHTISFLESALGLSAGYLSKVRHHAVRPSPQLAALLAVVLEHPEALATIRRATTFARPPPRGALKPVDPPPPVPLADGKASG